MLSYSKCYQGSCHGCCFNVLRYDGLDSLAAKLYLDQKILIPRIIEDLSTRYRMQAAVSEVRALYFTRLYGIEGSTSSGAIDDRGWASLQTVVYDATERGQTFERLRKESSVAANV